MKDDPSKLRKRTSYQLYPYFTISHFSEVFSIAAVLSIGLEGSGNPK
jgi:hypothetical protein